jgi:hypothetical protein
MADVNAIVDKMYAKLHSGMREGLDSLKGDFAKSIDEMKLLAAETKASLQAMTATLTDVTKKMDAVMGEHSILKQSQQRLSTQVTQLTAACSSTALLEERLNVMHLTGIPVQGAVNSQTAGAAVRRVLGDAGVTFSSTALAPNAVWSLHVIRSYSVKKKPGTANVVIKVLTSEERYLLLSPQVTSNLKAQGINIMTDLNPVEIQNKTKLFADPRFKAAYKRATDMRKEQGNAACVKRWVLDRCVLGTGNGRESVEWSVEYLQQLDAQQQAAASNMNIDLVNV